MDRLITTPDGRTLDVSDEGDPDGRVVIAHHGTPSTRLIYRPLIDDANSRGIRLIAYDRPGYGRSTRWPGRTVADCAVDVRAILDELDIDRCAVWGFSGGGPHALATAALLPDRVVAAASLAGVAPYDAPGLDFYADMGEANIEEMKLSLADPEAFVRMAAADHKELMATTPEGFVSSAATLFSPVDVEEMKTAVGPAVLAGMKEGAANGPEGWIDDSFAHLHPWGFDLDAITVPTQIWQGRHDWMVPFQHGEWLAKAVPTAEAHLSEDDGHMTLYSRRVPEVHAWLLEHF
jgi:pimeloyl-ACP methyl ester carboxylesterase